MIIVSVWQLLAALSFPWFVFKKTLAGISSPDLMLGFSAPYSSLSPSLFPSLPPKEIQLLFYCHLVYRTSDSEVSAPLDSYH